MVEKYVWTAKITAVEERFKEDWSNLGPPDPETGKRTPDYQSTGWWLTFDKLWSYCIGKKPVDDEGNLTFSVGDRVKFTMERI